MSLQDKVVIVTGSSTGVGEGIARELASRGARIVVHGFDPEEVAAVHASIPGSTSLAGDLAASETAERIVAHAISVFGRVDGLVNNAASSARSNIDNTTDEFFERLFAINVRAPKKMIQACMPHFRAQGEGRVVNIGSICAYGGPAHLLDYSMTKGALMAMTRNLAGAHAHEGIRVNQLNLGWTLTPNEYKLGLTDGMGENWPDSLPSHAIPLGRMLLPADVAKAVAYLLSDDALMLNGSVILFNSSPTSAPV